MKNKISVLYIPCKNKKEAIALGKVAIDNKLSACANIFPIDSLYVWGEKLTQDNETILLLKTLPKLSKKLGQLIESKHSYECSCILSLDAKVNKEYYKWMKQSIKSKE